MGNFFYRRKSPVQNANNFLPEPPPLLKGMLYIAIYDYISTREDELSFKANDLIVVAVKPFEPWWMGQHQKTLKRGYVPHNFVMEYINCHRIEPGWSDISRFEADHKLTMNNYPTGTYLIRPCSDPKYLVLTVKCLDENQQVIIKHHRIAFRAKEYYIDSKKKFTSLKSLISYYQKYNEGLLCKLKAPLQNDKHLAIQFRDIEIKRDSIKFMDMLGSGHFGEVFMAQLLDTKVAVKKLRKEAGDKVAFLKEAKLMHQLHHRRIVELVGVCTIPAEEPVYIITELMENGSLLEYLRKSKEGLITFNTMLIMLKEISEGMAYLESKSYIHRDLRTANILVGGDHSVKVADFGLAGIVEDMYIYAEEDDHFPIRWVAEEALWNNKFTLKSDVWSFGILMTEVITFGETPYKELKSKEVSSKVKNGYRMERPPAKNMKIPDKFYEIMELCWKKHRERPSFKELYRTFKNWVDEFDEV